MTRVDTEIEGNSVNMASDEQVCEFKSVGGLQRLNKALSYSLQGLVTAWKYEAAFRQELILVLLLLPIAILVDVALLERIALISVLVLVLIVELLNSAVEAAIDRIGVERHELSGRAKDLGAAAVFLTLSLVGFVWLSILGGRIVHAVSYVISS